MLVSDTRRETCHPTRRTTWDAGEPRVHVEVIVGGDAEFERSLPCTMVHITACRGYHECTLHEHGQLPRASVFVFLLVGVFLTPTDWARTIPIIIREKKRSAHKFT